MPGSRGLIYTPWLYGERCPTDDATLRAGLFNLSLEHTRADVIRAFYEGVALNTRWMLRPVRKFLGRRIESLVLIGGGATSTVWQRIFADVLDIPVRAPRDPLLANALGAAYIAAVGLGLMTFEDVSRHIDYSDQMKPDPANRHVYDERFRAFLEIHKRLRPFYRRLNGHLGGVRG
jgi:xylulokinase